MDVPCRVVATQHLEPLADAGLAGMDLLTPANQTDDDAPVMPIHAADKEVRLGLREVRPPLPLAHEATGLVRVPGSLCLAEQCHMLKRRSGILQTLIAKVMHVLDERLDTLARISTRHLFAFRLGARKTVANQRFAQHGYERSIPRQEHAVVLAVLVTMARSNVQAYQRLSRARHARDEANRFAPVASSFLDHAIQFR